MDRYLIDLLLEQWNRGNRIGQTFIAQAWIDMVTSFNANFRSHHGKDVLKNRYKRLKRQYNDIKILLEQRGFTWDEAREMVAAEDCLWDAYIEVHPDARSYRVKTVPNYHKLCVIYGQESSGSGYSRLACNVVPELGERKDDKYPAGTEVTEPYSNWTPQMDHIFIDLLLEQVQRAINIDNTFEDQIWADITTSFNRESGKQYDKCVLQNRYACFIKQYNNVKSLLDQNGFAWDDTRQIVSADDNVWEAYNKEYPHTISYRGIILEHYKDWCWIFGGTRMDEHFSCPSLGISINHSPIGREGVEFCRDLQKPVKEIETSDERKKRPTEVPSSASEHSSKLQKIGKDDDIREAFTDMANVVSKLVNCKTDKNYIAIERAVDALQDIPDIDDELLLDACDLLEDEKKAKTFLALDVSLRKKWLLRKLGH